MRGHGGGFMGLGSKQVRFFLAIALSLVLHGLFGGGLYLTPSHENKTPHQTSVELMSPEEMATYLKNATTKEPQKKAQQIVSSDSHRLNDEKDANAKYLSQFDQKVIRETRAAQSGKFSNSAGQGLSSSRQKNAAAAPAAQSAEQTSPSQTTASLDPIDSDQILTPPKSRLGALAPSFRKALANKTPPTHSATADAGAVASGDGQEISQTDDYLKEVPTGLQTMLSTREFVYYSYYNRIKDKLRQQWEPKIKEKFEKIMRQGRRIASTGDKTTQVVIILDDRGTLIRVQIIGQSGVTDLDDAAVEAFRAAAPFPNPPKGIVEKDGTIKIRWDFVLEA